MSKKIKIKLAKKNVTILVDGPLKLTYSDIEAKQELATTKPVL